jgi:hypothetical protein
MSFVLPKKRLYRISLNVRDQREVGRGELPAIRKLTTNVLEVVVSHVVNAKDEAVLVLGDRVADILEELVLVLARLLVDLGEVNDLCAS